MALLLQQAWQIMGQSRFWLVSDDMGGELLHFIKFEQTTVDVDEVSSRVGDFFG